MGIEIASKKRPVKTVIIKNTAKDFARFGVKNVPKDLLSHLKEQARSAKAVLGGQQKQDNLPEAYVRDNIQNSVFFNQESLGGYEEDLNEIYNNNQANAAQPSDDP